MCSRSCRICRTEIILGPPSPKKGPSGLSLKISIPLSFSSWKLWGILISSDAVKLGCCLHGVSWPWDVGVTVGASSNTGNLGGSYLPLCQKDPKMVSSRTFLKFCQFGISVEISCEAVKLDLLHGCFYQV